MDKNTQFVVLMFFALIVLALLDMSVSGLDGGEYYMDLFSVGGEYGQP